GSFEDRKNRMTTTDDRLSFLMEARSDGFYQTALVQRGEHIYAQSERIDLVTGSGNHGQSYLYWGEDDHLYQLPVSYFKSSNSWLNSPGYKDGTADFARPILPRCLECHSTFFDYVFYTRNKYVRDNFILGVTCERCHGSGSEHVAHHRKEPEADEARFIVHPGKLERDRLNEVCAQCHSGIGKPLKTSFTFRPGGRLEEYIKLDHSSTSARQGVHTANQLARLTMSRCFNESRDLTCATCHNPHRNEHARLDIFSKRCLKCHEVQQCRECIRDPQQAVKNCIDCHMPKEADQSIEMERMGGKEFPLMRDHFIRVLPGRNNSSHGRFEP
ncbi:multiheme c-type cytochrome, partial [Pirellulales bacterium]|nr:multiheme c-type cytochrome [Pirellulales bacterium]